MIAKALDTSRKRQDAGPTDGRHCLSRYRPLSATTGAKMTAGKKKGDSLVMPLASLRETAQICRNDKTFLQPLHGVGGKKSDFGRISVH
jgi:hypothetical protein